jgi:hypothetical protein
MHILRMATLLLFVYFFHARFKLLLQCAVRILGDGALRLLVKHTG